MAKDTPVVSSWCEALVRSADRMTQPTAPQQGVSVRRRPLLRELDGTAEGIPVVSSWCEALVRSCDRMTQPGAPQQGVSAGHRPLLREDGLPPSGLSWPLEDEVNSRGTKVCTVPFRPPHAAAVTPESLRSLLGRGGIGTPRGGLRRHYTTHPHTAADAPESLRSCLGRGGIGTPRGGFEEALHHPPPHSGGWWRGVSEVGSRPPCPRGSSSPRIGAALSVYFGIRTVLCPEPWAAGLVLSVGHSWLS